MCAFPGCEHKYTPATANATRVRKHVTGVVGGGVARCLKTTPADKAAASAHAPSAPPRSTSQLNQIAPTKEGL